MYIYGKLQTKKTGETDCDLEYNVNVTVFILLFKLYYRKIRKI